MRNFIMILVVAISCLMGLLIFYFKPSTPLFWGYAIEGEKITKSILDNLEQEGGQRADFIEMYLQWPKVNSESASMPIETFKEIWDYGAVPCLTWEPMVIDDNKEHIVSLDQITHGKYDSYLKRCVEDLKRWKGMVVIRFAHEMNLKRYHWGTDSYDNHNAAAYITLFRYVVDYFKKAQIKNVLWAFCPNVESIPNEMWNDPKNYYPGDAYVDILGMDGYNWGTTQTLQKNHWNSSWKSFKEIFQPLYSELKSLSPHKPMFVFETASALQGGDREHWLEEALKTCHKWNISTIIWFQVNKEVDWKLKDSHISNYISKTSSQFWIEKEFDK